MAEETHVALFHGKLPGKGASLNRAMKELDLPLAVRTAPGWLGRGVSADDRAARRVASNSTSSTAATRSRNSPARTPTRAFSAAKTPAGAATKAQMLAALCAAAALAKLVDGRVLDEAENKLLTVDQAVERARET